MKRNLQNYNQLPDKDPLDKLSYWASFAFLLGMGVGMGIATFIIL